MYVRPISTRLLRGMLTPAIRAKALYLPLSLLVSWIRADHENAPVAADDLALLAHRLHRRSYLHDPFRLMIQTGWLWRPVRPPLPCPRSARFAPTPAGPQRDEAEYQMPRAPSGRPHSAGPAPRSAACAANQPHMPCTPPPGGVAAEQRNRRGSGVV